jgi:guanylate kinase
MSNSRFPLLIVVSAPSGAGKTTLCDRLIAERPDMVYSVSCTTRAPRGEERDGRDYHFLSEPEFDRRLRQGLFLEHARVHGYRYGTLRETVHAALTAGRSVLMDIDVQGAAQVRAAVGRADSEDPIAKGFLDIFIAPPSLAILRERLEKRGEDAPQVVERRIRNATEELARRSEFSCTVVNDDLESAYACFRAVVEERGRGVYD